MKKSDLYGIIGSTIICGIILLLLLFIYMPQINKPDEEGIIVSFGDSYDAGGSGSGGEPFAITPSLSLSAPMPTAPPPPQPSVSQAPSREDLMTQEDNSLAIAQEKERKDREQKERADQIQRERIEKERKEKEQRENEERQQRQREATQRAETLGSVFGSPSGSGTAQGTGSGGGQGFGTGTGSGTGSGMGTGAGRQGNPAGRGNSGGNSWSLNGRALVGQFATPDYNKNVEGIITVDIKVNADGSVVNAVIGTPTTISDVETRNATLSAARRTKFSTGERDVFGTITYNFKLK